MRKRMINKIMKELEYSKVFDYGTNNYLYKRPGNSRYYSTCELQNDFPKNLIKEYLNKGFLTDAEKIKLLHEWAGRYE